MALIALAVALRVPRGPSAAAPAELPRSVAAVPLEHG
jgi:hypothetical protein